MSNFIDLHTHILPGLDDGPAEAEESLRILEGLEKMGFTHVFATPHHRLSSWKGLEPGEVEMATEEIRAMGAARGLGVKIHSGMEFDLDETLAERSRIRPGANGPLLVDVGFWGIPRQLVELLSPLQGEVCLVHPERNGALCRDGKMVEELVAGGIKLIGNLGSLVGLYGERVKDRCCKLVDLGLYWAFASDIHSDDQLDLISEGIHNLGALAGSDAVTRYLSHNPMAVLDNMVASK